MSQGPARQVVLPVPDERFAVHARVARDVMAATPDGDSYYGQGGELPHPDDSALHAIYFQVLGSALRVRALIDEVGTAGRMVRQAVDAALAEAERTSPDEGRRLAGLMLQYRQYSRSGQLQIHWRNGGRVSLNNRWHGESLVAALEQAVGDMARRNPPGGDASVY